MLKYFAKMPENKSGRRDVPVGIPLDLFTMEWYELPKYNGIQVSQLIYKRGRGGKKTRGEEGGLRLGRKVVRLKFRSLNRR